MKLVINTCYGGFSISDAAIQRMAELKGLTAHCTVPPEQQENQQPPNRPSNRADPALVQAVEELGDKAWGRYAELKVVEIPDGVKYEIAEYDGLEHVVEQHCTWN